MSEGAAMYPRQHVAHVSPPAQQTRVRWWAVALPLAAFVSLLCLLAAPGRADAHSAPIGLEGVVKTVPRVVLHVLP